VLRKNFLPASFHQTLVPYVLANQDRLAPAKVGNNEYRPDTRESLEIPGLWDGQVTFHDAVMAVLPEVLGPLHVASFEVGRVEVKLRIYLDGHFFRMHMDCPNDSPQNVSRRVSFVYFFHTLPRGYSGGGLLLFDTDIENNKFTTSSFTRMEPEDNTIVIFPSACYHSVIPVSCPSKEIANSRFVVNGHISRRVSANPTDAPARETPALEGAGPGAPAETGMVAASS
jgi:Rps23 Pro-64 3,4-dihydroxylase Tpa1-like proline 4-hydroxylase